MKQIINKTILAITACAITFSACNKKDDTEPEKPAEAGTVEIQFDNMVGNEDLALGSKSYKNYNGDVFNVSKFNYYISNIRLNTADGAVFIEPESYHLVKEDDAASKSFSLTGIPAGKYTTMTLMIGVDSIRNVSGAQAGALDAKNNMFWDWNSGYIMAKFEGTSPQSTAADNMLMYHVGGFSGTNNTVRTVALTLPQPIEINKNSYHMHIKADLAKWFGPGSVIDFGTLNAVHMPGANAKKIAENYKSMFSIQEVEKH